MFGAYLLFQESGVFVFQVFQQGSESRSEKYGKGTFLGSEMGSSGFVQHLFDVDLVTVNVVEDT